MQVRILPADSWSTLNDTKQEGRLYLMEKIYTDTSMDAAERLRRQMAFCLEIDKEKLSSLSILVCEILYFFC